jgi:hypothetical protein
MKTEKQRRDRRAYMHGWRQRNKGRTSARAQRIRHRNNKFVGAVKQHKGCCHCHLEHPHYIEFNPDALTFHHRDPESKLANVSDLATDGASIKRIKREMDMCDVVCASCHNILEARKRRALFKLQEQANVVSRDNQTN